MSSPLGVAVRILNKDGCVCACVCVCVYALLATTRTRRITTLRIGRQLTTLVPVASERSNRQRYRNWPHANRGKADKNIIDKRKDKVREKNIIDKRKDNACSVLNVHTT